MVRREILLEKSVKNWYLEGVIRRITDCLPNNCTARGPSGPQGR